MVIWARFRWDGSSLLQVVLAGLTLGKKKGHLAGWLGAGWSQMAFSLSLAIGWAVSPAP